MPQDTIDLRQLFKKVWNGRVLFIKVLPVVFVLSCVYILGFPRTYTTESKLAPEYESSSTGGMLSSLASTFGFDLGEMQTSDAITPLLYPDLMEDNGFIANLFNIRVKSVDGEIDCSYYDYLKNKQQRSIWSYPMSWLKSLIPSSTKKNKGGSGDSKFNAYWLSEDDYGVMEKIRGNISFDLDKRNGVITVNTAAQDPLICKTLADSVQERLQEFITNYRTNKARKDYEYYKTLTESAWHEYNEARLRYGRMVDANKNVTLRSTELKMESVENDMQMKYNAYTTMKTQMDAAKAKVQEKTPAFTVLKGADVPIKASKPKRMIFVLIMLFMGGMATTVYLLREELFSPFKAK